MLVLSGSDKAAIGHLDSIEIGTRETNRSRQHVNEIYRFVLEEFQKESHTAIYRKMIANNNYRDLLEQHHLLF